MNKALIHDSHAAWIPILLVMASLLGACSGSDDAAVTPTATPAPELSPTATAPRAACTDEQASARIRSSIVKIETESTQGSGIVVGEDVVLTNAHVIADAAAVRVTSVEGTHAGRITSLDRDADIGLLFTDTQGLDAVAWADTSNLVAGEGTLAVGFALGLDGEPTILRGVFSATRDEDGVRFVQTDVPLRQGMSGGPLLNACGEVAGINTLDFDGLSFAIEAGYLVERITELSANPRIDAAPPAGITVERVASKGGGCGSDLAVTPTEANIGRTYRQGDLLNITFEYGPGPCQVAVARFSGYFEAGTPWFDHWCNKPGRPFTCGESRLGAIFSEHNNPERFTARDGGSMTLEAAPGPFPPPNASTAPNLEGFRLCHVDVIFHDLAFNGDFVQFSVSGTAPC